MICQHNVAVAASGTNGEATHVIDVYLAAGFNPDLEFLALDDGELAGDVRKRVKGYMLRICLRGPGEFARLGEVSY